MSLRNLITGIILLTAGYLSALSLVPMPREMDVLDKTIRLDRRWTVYFDQENSDDAYAAQLIMREAEQCFGFQWEAGEDPNENKSIVIQAVSPDPHAEILFNEQGYILKIEKDRILIQAPSSTGRFYGSQTLRQVFRNASGRRIPQLNIRDYPALEWRGVSDDISRGQISTLENFLHIIEQLAFFKKNMYQPYIEDVFEFDINPMIGTARGRVTKAEMQKMVEYAQKNHVTLTPVFETLGHQDRLLSIPELRQYAEIQDPSKEPWSFAPVLPEAREFVTSLIDEMAQAAPSPFFHIGGDESFDIGEGVSREAAEKYGVGRVHADFFMYLYQYIQQEYGRDMMLYGDMLLHHPEALDYLTRDVIIVDWHYLPRDEYESIQVFKEAGFNNIMASPGIWSWAAFYPNYELAFGNIGPFIQQAKEAGLMGAITSSWGDSGAENIRENNWPGYAYSAAVSWEKGTASREEFLKNYVTVFYGNHSENMVRALTLLGWMDYMDSYYPAHSHFHVDVRFRILDERSLEERKILKNNMILTKEILAQIRKDDALWDNLHTIDLLEHVARRYLFAAERDLFLHRTAEQLRDAPYNKLSGEEKDKILRGFYELREEIIDISREYQDLWFEHGKYSNYTFNANRLFSQVDRLTGFIDACHSGELSIAESPTDPFFWADVEQVWHQAVEESEYYFVREFELEQKPASALLRCFADDRATVFINGHRVLQAQYGPTAPSTTVGHLLAEGKNYIAIQANHAYGLAALRFNLTIRFRDRSKHIISGDDKWRYSDSVSENWGISTPEGEEWKPVVFLDEDITREYSFLDW